MRRLVRRLFTLCSAVSLLLCVANVVVWPLSYRRAPYVSRHEWPTAGGRRLDQSSEHSLRVDRGRIVAFREVHKWSPERRNDSVEVSWHGGVQSRFGGAGWNYAQSELNRGGAGTTAKPNYLIWKWGGLALQTHRQAGFAYDSIAVPCLWVTPALLLMPAAWLSSWLRRRRQLAAVARGRCAA